LSMLQSEDPKAVLELRLSELFLHQEQRDHFFEELRSTGRVQDLEIAMVRKDGTVVWCQALASAKLDRDGGIEWIDGVLEDISERKRLEEQLRQSQKMEAIGTLAGGVAHDFNNLLTAIIGYANMSKEVIGPEDPLHDFMDNILKASGKASRLTQSLLAFSRKQVISLRPISLNETVHRFEKLLARVIGEDIQFKLALSDSEPVVLADSGQIEQVLLNLATNARDAMPGGGILSISTHTLEIEEHLSTPLAMKPGRYAVLAVSDTGSGMDEKTKQRIFEPFFTTKAIGRGTGLGLSIVYGIVKQHGGEINVYSEPTCGTTFRVYLKLVDAAPESEPEILPDRAVGGNETILLAEDDPMVRELYATVLRRSGYQVLEAVDGIDAVESYGKNPGKIHLLLFDVIMPRLNGLEACAEIQKLAPGVKVLYSSGYTDAIIHQRPLFEDGIQFISKPAAPTELLARVRRTLDEG
jgi:two-component system, cell cycle sensor histidine kinase and response regulator CckA